MFRIWLIRFLKRYSLVILGAVAVLTTIALIYTPPSQELREIGEITLVPASFLYGIFAGFYISVAVSENNHMRETTLLMVGSLDVMASRLQKINKDRFKKLLSAIDKYIQKMFEVEAIESNKNSTPEYFLIKDAVDFTAPKSKIDDGHYMAHYRRLQNNFDNFYDSRQRRAMISHNVIRSGSWFVLIFLGIVIIASFTLQGQGSLIYNTITVIASVAITTLMIITFELDNFNYHEDNVSYKQYAILYKDLGMKPYYIFEVIKSGRYIPEDEEFRIGFPDPNGGRYRYTIDVKKSDVKTYRKLISEELKKYPKDFVFPD